MLYSTRVEDMGEQVVVPVVAVVVAIVVARRPVSSIRGSSSIMNVQCFLSGSWVFCAVA